jgi:hypothetical protein
MEPAAPRGDFRLGDWLVEPSLNRFSRGAVVEHVRPRLMELLAFLARHAGQVVTKDQILEQVWQQRFVAESVLTRSIADLLGNCSETGPSSRGSSKRFRSGDTGWWRQSRGRSCLSRRPPSRRSSCFHSST